MKKTLMPALMLACVVAVAAPFMWALLFNESTVWPPEPEGLAEKSAAEQQAWYDSNRQKADPWTHVEMSARFVVDLPVGAAIIGGLAFVPAFVIGLFVFRHKHHEP